MSKKNILLLGIALLAVFTYGVSAGHYKTFPFDLLRDTKYLFLEPQEQAPHRPQIYQDISKIDGLIRIDDENDVLKKRNGLIQYIWLNNGFPYDKMPNHVEELHTHDFTSLNNLKQIISITVDDMEYGMNSISYLFLAESSNDKLIIFHQGHAEQSFSEDEDKIQLFLDRGYSVLMFSMVTHGLNNEPVIDFPEFGNLRLNSHDHFKLIESDTFHPIKYFFEPISVSLNYIDQKFDFQSYYMVGLSGGGWVTVVYPAIDPRITQSYSVAGSFPIWLRAASANFGDYEQTIPEFYRIANYEELYIMNSFGDDRRLVLFYNTFDPCCFSGTLYEEFPFGDSIESKLNELGKGEFVILLDDTHNEHKISDWTMNKILELMEDSST